MLKSTLYLLLIVLVAFIMPFNLKAQNDVKAKNAEFNEKCLKCHGQSKYKYMNPESGAEVTKRMYLETIINRAQYAESNHGNFTYKTIQNFRPGISLGNLKKSIFITIQNIVS